MPDVLVEFLAGQLTAPANAQLAVRMREMRLHGVQGQVQLRADLPVGSPGLCEASDCLLLRTELPRGDAAGAAPGPPKLGSGLVGVPARSAGLCLLQGCSQDLAGPVALTPAGQDRSVRGERP